MNIFHSTFSPKKEIFLQISFCFNSLLSSLLMIFCTFPLFRIFTLLTPYEGERNDTTCGKLKMYFIFLVVRDFPLFTKFSSFSPLLILYHVNLICLIIFCPRWQHDFILSFICRKEIKKRKSSKLRIRYFSLNSPNKNRRKKTFSIIRTIVM